MIEIKILDKRIEEPEKATIGSAGFDLKAAIDEPIILLAGECKLIPTGLAIYIKDPSIVATILPRSKRGAKTGLVVGNMVGVIDSDYQGQWYIAAWNRNFTHPVTIQPLEEIAQALFIKLADVTFTKVEEFTDETIRSDGGISKDVDSKST